MAFGRTLSYDHTTPTNAEGALTAARSRTQSEVLKPQSSRMTPAMAAGVTDKLWEMQDIAEMLEAWENQNSK